MVKWSLPSCTVFISSTSVKMECEREEPSFINVAPTVRFCRPLSMTRFTVSSSCTTTLLRPLTCFVVVLCLCLCVVRCVVCCVLCRCTLCVWSALVEELSLNS